MDTKTIDTSIDEFDEEAFDEALEAYWSADGGTYGGVRAAIRKYNDLVAGRQALGEADARDGGQVMLDYHFPREDELFLSTPYTGARDEAKARTTAILAKSYGQTAGILLGSFMAVSILLVAAHSGLTRVEQQFQADARR